MYGGLESAVIGSKTSSGSKTAIITGWLVPNGRRLTNSD